MNWQESEHPRDEDGKFTFKNGGGNNNTNNSPANILYGKVDRIEKQNKDVKTKLLNILGNKATPTDILYGDEKSLTKKIKKNGLSGKLTGGASNINNNEKYMTPMNQHKTSFQKDTAKHEILRQLSVYCYDNRHQEIPKDYKRVGYFTGKNNGFDSVVVKNDKTKEIVIAFRGMNPFSRDLPSVGRIRTRDYTSQQKDAQAVYEKMKNKPDFKGYEIYTTGTSLGGYLAQYVAAKNNLKSATFNAYNGVKDSLLKEMNDRKQSFNIYPDNIVNYRNKDDELSKSSTNNNLGISLDAKANIRLNEHPKYHFAENIGGLNQAKLRRKDFGNHLTEN